MPLLEVNNLVVRYRVDTGASWRSQATLTAVDEVSFSLNKNESLGLVGESGCGKSTLGRAVLRLLEPASGKIVFDGQDITHSSSSRMRPLRRRMQMIFQDPAGSLDPRMTVEESVGEALSIHRLAANRKDRRAKVESLLQRVGLTAEHADRFPHEFSGGQRQRIGIARALAVQPELLVCDEPVSALDVSVQAQIVNLLQDQQAQSGVTYLFISHDLAVVEHLCQRLMVMYLGRVMEYGSTKAITQAPAHPYTQALITAIPTLRSGGIAAPTSLRGEVPSRLAPPTGCPFHPRCPIAEKRCREEVPQLRTLASGQAAACHLAG
ncbi:MAG TPA: ABC transporter ATP-binding protein [Candidatus Limnocylindria bacterium]|nr:ABC transporter ATP-binding protein [Candidatus Limnocylindria bacterium]